MGNIPVLKEVLQDPTNEAKMKTLFNSYDLDRNGFLTRSEFKTFATNFWTVLETGPHADKLKKLNIKNISEFAETLFDASDDDGDKKISYDEFASLMYKPF